MLFGVSLFCGVVLVFSCLYHCFCMKYSQLTIVICFSHIDQILLLIVNSDFC